MCLAGFVPTKLADLCAMRLAGAALAKTRSMNNSLTRQDFPRKRALHQFWKMASVSDTCGHVGVGAGHERLFWFGTDRLTIECPTNAREPAGQHDPRLHYPVVSFFPARINLKLQKNKTTKGNKYFFFWFLICNPTWFFLHSLDLCKFRPEHLVYKYLWHGHQLETSRDIFLSK